MVAIHQGLLVVGGYGSPQKNSQPLAQCDEVLTTEHHLHNLGTGELRSAMTCAVCVCVCLQDLFVCGWLIVYGWRMIEVVVVWRVGHVPVQQWTS